MGLVYFKRFRMEYDLTQPLPRQPRVPESYVFVPWDDQLLDAHAEVKFRCFQTEMDANVFPSLGDRGGCLRLMTEIVRRSGFVPQATWLLEYWPSEARKPELCGTIQGVADEGTGAIQNVGITAAHRGRGLGTALLWHSLRGFQQAGIDRVYLEVTAQNNGACQLYRRLGFRQTKVVYKASEVACAEA
jgi:ribosomal protein S18 acetylase RimI-like enzyme